MAESGNTNGNGHGSGHGHCHRHKPPIDLAPLMDWGTMKRSDHFVQFYEQDSHLERLVAGFIGTGLRQGETAIVIATAAHREGIERRLREQGIDIEAEESAGTFFSLDASQTLAKFTFGGKPDGVLFRQVIGSLVAKTAGTGKPLRAFGEMVALLWRDGNTDAAIALEELWNELAADYSFCLMCAYPMEGFGDETNGQPFARVCESHTAVFPAESYTGTADERLRAITVLQQKAAALEAEVARRKQMESELARQKRELADFLQSATEGIHQIAPDGKILWANKAELELLGYTAQEYIGQDVRQFHADREVIEDMLERLGRGEELHDYEARLRHKDGSLRYVSINSNGYWDQNQFRYTRCFTRDVTEHKLAAEQLERAVTQRTAELRETIAELEAFSYSISHDMRSPLRAMQGFAHMILMDYAESLPPEVVDMLGRIQRGAARLDLLVRDVLSYSKVSRGDVRLYPVELGSLIEDLLGQLPELQEARERTTLEHPIQNVLGHEGYLSQCLTNLIENALKFVEPGQTPEIRIHTEAIGMGSVRVCVTDKGIGIAPEHRSRIFQIFGRIHSEQKYPGTGIGLAIVKRAVERMGGEVGFESEPCRGTRFWFILRSV